MSARHRNSRGWWRKGERPADEPTFDPAVLRVWNRWDGLDRERRDKNRRADRRWLALRSLL